MAVVIQRATYGNGTTNTDVTAALARRIASDRAVNIPVNSGLIPFFSMGDSVTLTEGDLKLARQQAEESCGGPQNSICVAKKFEDVKSTMIDEKRDQSNRIDNLVRGNRLEATVRVGNQVKKIAVPEGQIITEDSLAGRPPKGTPPIDIKATTSSVSLSSLLGQAAGFLTGWVATVVGVFLYAISVVLTWVSFNTDGYPILKYGMTAVSALIPLSGFFIVPTFFGLRAFAERIKPMLDAAKLEKSLQ